MSAADTTRQTAPVAHAEPAATKKAPEAATRIARKESPALASVKVQPQPQAPAQPLKVAAASTTPLAPETTLKLDTVLASIQRIVPFAFSAASIGPRGRKALAEIVPLARQAERVTVRGRTDSWGSAAQNRHLAPARASSVMYAIVNSGVSRKVVKATYCTTCFIASNDTEQGRRTNRRVDIEVVMPAKLAMNLPKPIYSAPDAEEGPAVLARLDDQFTSMASVPGVDKRN